jgi:hypothetical protein
LYESILPGIALRTQTKSTLYAVFISFYTSFPVVKSTVQRGSMIPLGFPLQALPASRFPESALLAYSLPCRKRQGSFAPKAENNVRTSFWENIKSLTEPTRQVSISSGFASIRSSSFGTAFSAVNLW